VQLVPVLIASPFPSLQMEPVPDADARQLVFKAEMDEQRKAMRAVPTVPEAAPPAEVVAEAAPPQVPSSFRSLIPPPLPRRLRPQKMLILPIIPLSLKIPGSSGMCLLPNGGCPTCKHAYHCLQRISTHLPSAHLKISLACCTISRLTIRCITQLDWIVEATLFISAR
jgi:hypothetical protein